MNEEHISPSFVVTLSREELLAVLQVLRAPTIPGLDREPSGELAPDQEAFAVVVARRALLARGLAQTRDDGELLLERGLLTAVGACAYAQASILAYHWPAGAAAALRLFGHVRGDDVVAHTRPDAVLHRFALLPSREALVRQVLDFCQAGAAGAGAGLDLTVPRQEFADARQLAGAGDGAAAAALLAGSGAPEPAAAALVATWAAAPRVSVLQTLAGGGARGARTNEFTLVQDGDAAWWVAPVAGDVANGLVRARTVSGDEIGALLAGGL